MSDLKDRFNPRSEEEGLMLEAEEAGRKGTDSSSEEYLEESPEASSTEDSPKPAKKEISAKTIDDSLTNLVSSLDIKPRVSEQPSAELPKESAKAPDATVKEPDSTLIESSYEVKVKLADIQADPNSPLYSAKSFEELGL